MSTPYQPVTGHDGLTWWQRRAARKREAAIRAMFFDGCADHGEQPIDPYDDALLLCGCERRRS